MQGKVKPMSIIDDAVMGEVWPMVEPGGDRRQLGTATLAPTAPVLSRRCCRGRTGGPSPLVRGTDGCV